jgi:chorismate mutase
MSIWELIKKLIDAFLSFFKARKEERHQVAVEKAAETIEADKADREEVDRVKEEVGNDIDKSGGDADAYERAFDRVRREFGDDEPPGGDDVH